MGGEILALKEGTVQGEGRAGLSLEYGLGGEDPTRVWNDNELTSLIPCNCTTAAVS